MTTEELEFSEVGRPPWNPRLVGAVAAILLVSGGAVLGFFIGWIYPVIHGFLQRHF